MLNQKAYPPPTSMIGVAPSTEPERLTIPSTNWIIYHKTNSKIITLYYLSPKYKFINCFNKIFVKNSQVFSEPFTLTFINKHKLN